MEAVGPVGLAGKVPEDLSIFDIIKVSHQDQPGVGVGSENVPDIVADGLGLGEAESGFVVFGDFDLGLEMNAEDAEAVSWRGLHGDIENAARAVQRHSINQEWEIALGVSLDDWKAAQQGDVARGVIPLDIFAIGEIHSGSLKPSLDILKLAWFADFQEAKNIGMEGADHSRDGLLLGEWFADIRKEPAIDAAWHGDVVLDIVADNPQLV